MGIGCYLVAGYLKRQHELASAAHCQLLRSRGKHLSLKRNRRLVSCVCVCVCVRIL